MDTNTMRDIAFGEYRKFISYAKHIHGDLVNKGVPLEEIVHEAIISVLDSKKSFNNKQDLVTYIKTAITNIGWHEKSLLKNFNYSTKINRNGEEYTVKPNKFIDTPSEEFIQIYNLFELTRFGNNRENLVCAWCYSTSFYQSVNDRFPFKCKGCGKKTGITAKTYLNYAKLSYRILFKAVAVVCRDIMISSRSLAKRLGVSQKTAWYRKHLIVSAIETIDSLKISAVLKKLLLNSETDSSPIKMKKTGIRKYSSHDISEIRRLDKNKVYKRKDIAKMYFTDSSTLSKIIRGILYADVAMPESKLESNRDAEKKHIRTKPIKYPVVNGYKVCSACNDNIQVSAFRERILKNGKKWINSTCRKCENKYCRKWREENPDKQQLANKRVYEKNYFTVSDKYIKNLVRYKNKELTPDDIKKIRDQILFERNADKDSLEYKLLNKYCRDCGCKIDESNFYHVNQTGRKKTIIPSLCKLCRNKRATKSFKKKKDDPEFKKKNRQRVNEYYHANKEVCNEKQRAYHKSDRYKKLRKKKYYESIDKYREMGRNHYYKNREKIKARSRAYKGDVEKMTDGYIKQLIFGKQKNVHTPAELIELKRTQLKLTREIKKQLYGNIK